MVDWEKQFFDRRKSSGRASGGAERRQFADSHADLSAEAREFAQAVDAYKIAHGRKFITLAELFEVFTSLGYHK
ncbi:MAG: hypothetical protein JXL80_08145 [Planctomycetes bacterium]|nr:hypothetical protein [Planctomycetota bacterium]